MICNRVLIDSIPALNLSFLAHIQNVGTILGYLTRRDNLPSSENVVAQLRKSSIRSRFCNFCTCYAINYLISGKLNQLNVSMTSGARYIFDESLASATLTTDPAADLTTDMAVDLASDLTPELPAAVDPVDPLQVREIKYDEQ